MTGPRKGERAALLLAFLLLIAAAVGTAFLRAHYAHPWPPRAAKDRPPLLLLTSLPLVFGERLSLNGGGSATLTALETRYRVVPIPVADVESLGRGKILFMAHAPAQPAENLVILDRWVRSGGHVLLLADPQLDWESTFPLGDAFRPSPIFPDTGLLAHWGLQLDGPVERGLAKRRVEGRVLETRSPGRLAGRCTISPDGLVANCRVGKGKVSVIADADFLDVDRLDGGKGNLDILLGALASLEPK